jgi:BolA-like protein 1
MERNILTGHFGENTIQTMIPSLRLVKTAVARPALLNSHHFESLNLRSSSIVIRSMSSTPAASTSAESQFPVADAIHRKLEASFQPVHLEVINESHMHNVPKNSETHFKVVVVSSQFDDVNLPIKRHRLINTALKEELDGPVHALSIVAKSPSQWSANSEITPSPNCKGGDGSLPSKKDGIK